MKVERDNQFLTFKFSIMVFIPWVVAGAGAALIAWGAKMIFNDDDSADKKVAEFIRKLPEHVRKNVDRVEFKGDGFAVYWKPHLSAAERRRLEDDIS